ncbi:hypothetical protein ILUMI_19477 [Ignelater luminosus]|uniref:Ionotropic glutamate receptor C-terminal domain-containing protein n=1 Tax=Ignelater luminosus TaxID=2038154 RepID=A0A8K0G5J9_IGNLU|nr:hypothetical protein ILUMI_19477 [Ignelater luminosus]
MTWAVPKPATISSVKVIVVTLKWAVWATIVLTSIVTSFVWYLFAKALSEHPFENLQKCILITITMVIGVSLSILPKSRSLRVLGAFYMFYCLEISTIFQGKLFSILRHPPLDDKIDTMEKLANSTLSVIGGIATRNTLQRQQDNPIFAKLYNRFLLKQETLLADHLTELVSYKNCGTIVGKGMMRNMFVQLKGMVDLIEHNSGLLEFEVSFAIRKGNPFLKILNEFCKRLAESGIYMKFFSEAVAQFELPTQSQVSVLTIQHLEGPFYLWIVGLLLAVLVFILELAQDYLAKKAHIRQNHGLVKKCSNSAIIQNI